MITTTSLCSSPCISSYFVASLALILCFRITNGLSSVVPKKGTELPGPTTIQSPFESLTLWEEATINGAILDQESNAHIISNEIDGTDAGDSNDDEQFSDAIRLITWNLLAPVYGQKERFPSSHETYLDWSYREPKIVEKLLSCNADIICLQEVQVDLWPEFIQKFEKTSSDDGGGYIGILQNATRNNPMTNAILIKKSSGLKIVRQESRSRALILVLDQEMKQKKITSHDINTNQFGSASLHHEHDVKAISNNYKDEDRCMRNDRKKIDAQYKKQNLYLACVHLMGGKNENETRVNQLKSLLKRVQKHVILDNIDIENSQNQIFRDASESVLSAAPPIILAGDFNMRQNNPIHGWLDGSMNEENHHNIHNAFRSNKDLGHDQSDEKQGNTDLEKSTADTITFPDEVPFLPLQDVYHNVPPSSGQLAMTYCGGSVLDYIWTASNSVRTIQTLELDPSSQIKAQKPKKWPSMNHPSDHLPIGVDLQYKTIARREVVSIAAEINDGQSPIKKISKSKLKKMKKLWKKHMWKLQKQQAKKCQTNK